MDETMRKISDLRAEMRIDAILMDRDRKIVEDARRAMWLRLLGCALLATSAVLLYFAWTTP
jgi:hypothetical protein